MRILLTLLLLLTPLAARAQTLTVAAAASLTDVLRDIGKLWETTGHPAPRFNFAASSTLARQLEQGAPGDIFASADAQWMDYAAQHNLILPATRRDLLGNRLVLVMPKTTARPVTIDRALDIPALLGATGRLAVGDPSNVPAGIYAKQSFTRLGLWPAIEPRLAPSDSVRSALLLVERGEVPAGVVYETDVAVSPTLVVAGIFPDASHDPITYPFALTKSGDTPDGRGFLTFLSTPPATAAFQRRGFSILPN